MIPAPTIICPDCGATAQLTGFLPSDEEPQPGDVVTYRCPACLERLDIIIEGDGDQD